MCTKCIHFFFSQKGPSVALPTGRRFIRQPVMCGNIFFAHTYGCRVDKLYWPFNVLYSTIENTNIVKKCFLYWFVNCIDKVVANID